MAMSDISFGEYDGDFEIPDSLMMPNTATSRPAPLEPSQQQDELVAKQPLSITVDGVEYTILRPGKKYMDVKTPVTRKVCEENIICWNDTWIIGHRQLNYDVTAQDDPEKYNEWDCIFVAMTDHTPYKALNLTCANVISTTTNRLGGGPQEPTPNSANRISIQFGGEQIWVPPRPDSSVSKSKRKNVGGEDNSRHKIQKLIITAPPPPTQKLRTELTKSFVVDMGCDLSDNGRLVTHGKSLLDWAERPEPVDEPDAHGQVSIPPTVVAAAPTAPAPAGQTRKKKPKPAAKAANIVITNTAADTCGVEGAGNGMIAVVAAAGPGAPFDGMTHREAMRAMRKYIGENPLVPVRQRSLFRLLMGICKRQVDEKKYSGGAVAFTAHTLTKLELSPDKWTEHDMVTAIKGYGGGDKQVRKALVSDWNSIQAAFNELFAPEYTANF